MRFTVNTLLSLGFIAISAFSSAWAETETIHNPTVDVSSEGYNMLQWSQAPTSMVEQVQQVHRLNASASQGAVQSLFAALDSKYELVRRKASQELADKCAQLAAPQQKELLQSAQQKISNNDPVVQYNMVRLIASLNIPGKTEALIGYFKRTARNAQLDLIQSMGQDPVLSQKVLLIARANSPYTDVRQAANDYLR